jgi:aspartate aminotransferase
MSRPFAANFQAIGLSPIVAISEKIRSLAPEFEKGGEKFAYLQRGELADPTPDFVVQATQRAVAAGLTRYPKAGGEPWFKAAVIEHLEAEHGITGLGPEHVICTYGGQEGLQLVFGLLAGGRVLSFAPVWSCVLENTFPYTDYTLVTTDLKETGGRLEVDWADFEAKLPGVDVLYLNSPHNPTGKVFSREEIIRIDALCRRHGVRIVSDEAYKDFVFDGREHFSPLALGGDHIIGVYTCSKGFASTGFRIGFTVCRDADLIHRLTLGEYTQTAGVVPFIQKAFAEALTDNDARPRWQSALREALQRRRDMICERLEPVFGDTLTRPEGAFYVFPNLAGLVPEPVGGERVSDVIVQRFLDHGIAVVPGTAFGDESYARHVRISFSGVSDEVLEAGLDRMLTGVLMQEDRIAG